MIYKISTGGVVQTTSKIAQLKHRLKWIIFKTQHNQLQKVDAIESCISYKQFKK